MSRSFCKWLSLGVLSELRIARGERHSRTLNDIFFFCQAVMVLKDIPYRDGKLFYVKCTLKYLQRIVLSSRSWFSSVSDTCELPDIRDSCAVTCATCVILVTRVTCVTCDYVRL